MSKLDLYPLMYMEIHEVSEPDADPLFTEQERYVPLCEHMDSNDRECPNKATVEWYRHGDGDYFYTLRCDEHPPAQQDLYNVKEL